MTSLAESVRYSCEKIKEAFPDAQIVLITPMQIGKPGVTGIHKIGDIIEECGHYMSLSVIRLDYGGTIQGAREINRRFLRQMESTPIAREPNEMATSLPTN